MLFIQTACLLCVLLLSATFLTYAAIALLIIMLFLFAALLFMLGLELIATLLLFCELHAMFLLFCLALSWVRFDAQLSSSLRQNNAYIVAAFLFLPALFFLAVSTANGTTCGEFCFDFVNLILVANTNVYTALCGTTYVQYVALATVYFSAAEFVILNIFMLLAVLLYVAIQVFIQNARFLKAAVDYAELAKAGIAAGFVLRSQSQNIQLARTTAVKFFLKKTPKGLKIPGKRTVTREAAKD